MIRARRFVLSLLAVLALLGGRSLVEGRSAIRSAREHETRGEIEPAIGYAMRATKWYVPFASHPREGYDLLRTIARRAEAAGETDTALFAWQAIRGGTRASRSLYLPYADRAREADAQIASLLAGKPAPGIDRDKPRERLVEEHRALLALPDGPAPLAVLALYLGLALGLFGTYRALGAYDAARDASPTSREELRRRGYAAIAMAVLGLLTFAVAVARA